MEVKDIITTLSGAGGLFLLILSPQMDVVATLLLLIPFGLIFVSRLVHFLLMQYNRLNSQLHSILNIVTLVSSVLTVLGMIFGKYLAVGTFLNPLPFDYYLLVGLMSSISLVLSVPIIRTKFEDSLNIGDKKIIETKQIAKELAEPKEEEIV